MSSAEIFLDDVFYIYTDGSSIPSPRKGGLGFRFINIDSDGKENIYDYCPPGYKNSTNNQMELMACVLALRECNRLKLAQGKSRIVIRTDSIYIVDNYKRAMFEWSKNRWFKREGGPVLNADIWKDLLKEIKKAGIKVDFEWVHGHADSTHNKAVDKLAKRSANVAEKSPLSLVHVRRKKTNKSVKIGSVKMFGQRIKISIITTEYLKVQKLWKCKYEVISEDSEFYENVDIIFSEELLGAGHSYFIEFNNEENNPRVVSIIHEITDD